MRILTSLLFLLTYQLVFGQTQAEMNKIAIEDYKKADIELNEVYNQILTEYEDDQPFIDALKTSQRNWITFRDSELKMKYPVRPVGWYGSIHSMCIAMYKEELTRTRIETLRNWLDSVDEGDACEGSIRSR